MSKPAFPDILAVDPRGCGCTECIIGEYVPQATFEESATAADLAALVSGQVGNNTYDGIFDLVMTNSYRTESAREFQRRMREALYMNMDVLSRTAEEIADWISE